MATSLQKGLAVAASAASIVGAIFAGYFHLEEKFNDQDDHDKDVKLIEERMERESTIYKNRMIEVDLHMTRMELGYILTIAPGDRTPQMEHKLKVLSAKELALKEHLDWEGE